MPINEEHPVLNIPRDNISIWKYMDIPSFLSLLSRKALAFIRADMFEDKYEGTLPKFLAASIDSESRKQIEDGKIEREYWNMSEILNKHNKNSYLNCWCKGNHEMVHMWKIYSKERGVAIETDYNRIKKSILSKDSVYPSEINYVDFKNGDIEWTSNLLKLYTIKRKEYQSESEFRLIIGHPGQIEDQLLLVGEKAKAEARKRLYKGTPVIYCDIDVKILISKIHLSPYAPKWYLDFLIDILAKYGLKNVQASQSDL